MFDPSIDTTRSVNVSPVKITGNISEEYIIWLKAIGHTENKKRKYVQMFVVEWLFYICIGVMFAWYFYILFH